MSYADQKRARMQWKADYARKMATQEGFKVVVPLKKPASLIKVRAETDAKGVKTLMLTAGISGVHCHLTADDLDELIDGLIGVREDLK